MCEHIHSCVSQRTYISDAYCVVGLLGFVGNVQRGRRETMKEERGRERENDGTVGELLAVADAILYCVRMMLVCCLSA